MALALVVARRCERKPGVLESVTMARPRSGSAATLAGRGAAPGATGAAPLRAVGGRTLGALSRSGAGVDGRGDHEVLPRHPRALEQPRAARGRAGVAADERGERDEVV